MTKMKKVSRACLISLVLTCPLSYSLATNMRLVFLFSTTALAQSLHARKSSTTVQISCLSKFLRGKLQIHKEVAVQKTRRTATNPMPPLKVANNPRVRIGKEVAVPRNLGIGTHLTFLKEVGKSQRSNAPGPSSNARRAPRYARRNMTTVLMETYLITRSVPELQNIRSATLCLTPQTAPSSTPVRDKVGGDGLQTPWTVRSPPGLTNLL